MAASSGKALQGRLLTMPELNDRKSIIELCMAAAQAAHAEYHFIETLMNNPERKDLQDKVHLLRDNRRKLLLKLTEARSAVKGMWCTVKHLLLLEMHLFELFEQTGDREYLGIAGSYRLWLDELLADDSIGELKRCSRCKEDSVHV